MNTAKTIQLNDTYTVVVTKGAAIAVKRKDHPVNIFSVGDMAEYDSYNLSYYGPIVSIGEKTVTIKCKWTDKKTRLSFDKFAWRNYDFNVEKAASDNADTMMYI